jgi:hypothetical protein
MSRQIDHNTFACLPTSEDIQQIVIYRQYMQRLWPRATLPEIQRKAEALLCLVRDDHTASVLPS